MSIKIEERADELIDYYACDDDAVLKLALRVAELEWERDDLRADIEDWKEDVRAAERRATWGL